MSQPKRNRRKAGAVRRNGISILPRRVKPKGDKGSRLRLHSAKQHVMLRKFSWGAYDIGKFLVLFGGFPTLVITKAV